MIFFEHHTNFEQHANVGSLGSRSKDQIYQINQDLATVGGSGQVQKHSKAKSRRNPCFFCTDRENHAAKHLNNISCSICSYLFQSLVQDKTNLHLYNAYIL